MAYEGQKVESLGKSSHYKIVSSVPVKEGKLEIMVEPVILIGKSTGKKEYGVHVVIGNNANISVFSAQDEQECKEIAKSIDEGDYDLVIENGILGIRLRD